MEKGNAPWPLCEHKFFESYSNQNMYYDVVINIAGFNTIYMKYHSVEKNTKKTYKIEPGVII